MQLHNHKGTKYQADRMSAWILSSLCITLYFGVQEASAAPESRGEMGTVVTLSAGGFMGTGTDGEGARNTSQLGGSFHLMLGEEVLPRLFMGLGIDSYFGSGQDESISNTSQLFSFGFEGRYRLTDQRRGMILLAGLGIGVGGVVSDGESLTDAEGSGGGSIWKVGLGYELGSRDSKSEFVYVPSCIFQRLGPQMDNKVSLNIISLNLEVLYAAGR